MKYFSLRFIFTRQSSIIPLPTCNRLRCVQKLIVVSLQTSARRMPKKGKVCGRGTQQAQDPARQGEEEGISSVISLTKDGQICVKILAKPGAKQSNITGGAQGGTCQTLCTIRQEGSSSSPSPSPTVMLILVIEQALRVFPFIALNFFFLHDHLHCFPVNIQMHHTL